MTVYYIAVSGWDGYKYSFDYIRPFASEEKRDEAYERMKETPAYKNAWIDLAIGEEEIEGE